MTSLMASPGLLGLLATMLAGISAFLVVLALMPAAPGGQSLKVRVASVKNRREQLKTSVKIDKKDKKKGAIDDDTLALMRSTIERFRMQDLIENTDLRISLAQAGYRGQKAPVIFLFFKIVMPLLLALTALFYFSVLYAGEFDAFRHGLICVMVMGAGYILPGVWLKNVTQKRQALMQRAYPDALDLTVICVESGMSVERAFQWVAEEIAPQSTDLAEEIALTTAELSFLGDRSLAYENFSRRSGMQQVKALTGALGQAERYGTPVASALRVLSEESRNERMSMAERKAASLPAKLTVPMIVFFLPVLFIVIIGPAAIQVMDGDATPQLESNDANR